METFSRSNVNLNLWTRKTICNGYVIFYLFLQSSYIVRLIRLRILFLFQSFHRFSHFPHCDMLDPYYTNRFFQHATKIIIRNCIDFTGRFNRSYWSKSNVLLHNPKECVCLSVFSRNFL